MYENLSLEKPYRNPGFCVLHSSEYSLEKQHTNDNLAYCPVQSKKFHYCTPSKLQVPKFENMYQYTTCKVGCILAFFIEPAGPNKSMNQTADCHFAYGCTDNVRKRFPYLQVNSIFGFHYPDDFALFDASADT